MADQVIATENAIVHDAVLGIDRQVVAGLPVPPDLVEAYKEDHAVTGPGEAVPAHSDTATDDAAAARVEAAEAERDRAVELLENARATLDAQRQEAEGALQEVKAALEEAQKEAAAAKEEVPWELLSPEALTVEAEKRGVPVTGTGAGGNVKKADVIAALKAGNEQ